MAQWRVAKCSTAQELEQLVESAASEHATRYYAAEKLIALEDRKRNTRLAKSSSMSFERFLKEHHSKQKMDWRNREGKPHTPEAQREHLDKSFPDLRHSALPRFADSATSKSAQIARDLLRRDAVRAIDESEVDDDIRKIRARSNNHSPSGDDRDERGDDDDDDDDNDANFSFGGFPKSKGGRRRVSLDEAFGVREALDQLQQGDFPPTEEQMRAERRERARRRLQNRGKLLASSAMADLPYDDQDFAPGIAFWKHLPCTDPALARGGFMPDTLVIEPGRESCVLIFDTGSLGATKERKITSERFIIAREMLADTAFQDVFLYQVRKTRRPRGQPLFIVKYGDDRRAHLLFSTKEVEELLLKLAKPPSCDTGEKNEVDAAICLQRFVRPSGKRPWLVRLIYAENGTAQVFTLSSQHSVPSHADDTSDAVVAAQWLTDTRHHGKSAAARDQADTEIVYGGAKKEAAGTFVRPCEIAKAILQDIARHTGARFQKMCFEFIRTQSGKWQLIHVRGFGGLHRPKALGAQTINDDRATFATSPTSTSAESAEGATSAKDTETTQGQDEKSKEDQDSKLQDGKPQVRVPVCYACAKVYRARQQHLELSSELLQKRGLASSFSEDLDCSHDSDVHESADAKNSNKETFRKHRALSVETSDNASDAGSSKSQARARTLARQSSGTGVPYSSDMLEQNRSLYAKMVAKQRKHIAVAQREQKSMEDQIEDKLLASPTEDFALVYVESFAYLLRVVMEGFLRALHSSLADGVDKHGDGEDGVGLDLEVVLAEEVLTYLNAAAEEGLPLEDFLDVLSGFCPDLDVDRACGPDVQALYAKLTSDQGDQEAHDEATSPEPPAAPSVPQPVQEVDFAKMLETTNVAAETSKTTVDPNEQEDNKGVKNGPAPPTPEEADKIAQVLAVCPPDANRDAVLHTMRKLCQGDPERTAMFVLDRGIDQVHAIFRRDWEDKEALAKQQAELDAKEQERVKRNIMNKFDEVAVTTSTKPKSAAAAARENRKAERRARKKDKESNSSSQIRYLDGQIVSRKGGKYMIIDDTKEWDGGSRGRVKTKGKRGTGWAPYEVLLCLEDLPDGRSEEADEDETMLDPGVDDTERVDFVIPLRRREDEDP
ncbi:Hypothetical Protein FCC1311_000502 [Hondaea fermentalgiana]|uniref:Uncharacterized protein n=1 Tax=Hondaea fermentalgiana TaxID=2315210 RepID=A0A2R5FYM4_9STRA|nr:Hypothetical Protein FCC1311_000502 [Hondaea fermentalgiana]|eukprot:GBG23830.1 Hypothetical Protein FCC1311_000502 [Hondaea fermentalgiana]